MSIYQFTGLSGSGKTTIANMMKEVMDIEIIDGDEFRKTHTLGFDRMSRVENIRMMHRKALSFSKDVIISAINPYDSIRNEIPSKIVYFKCDDKTLQERDTKGLYENGILPDGLQYEEPENCLVINTGEESIETSFRKVFNYINKEQK